MLANQDYASAAALQEEPRQDADAETEQRLNNDFDAHIKGMLANDDCAGAAMLQEQARQDADVEAEQQTQSDLDALRSHIKDFLAWEDFRAQHNSRNRRAWT
ncbi:hypothetical protein N9L19_00175 [bacterium]|nr:hypothetical protein [bacterium]MDA8609308.1 hypothetical protein [bacterium]